MRVLLRALFRARAAFAIVAATIFLTPAALAQLSITWSTIDGGGGTSTGGTLTLRGTIGQHDAGGAMSGGTLSLQGGFWAGATAGIPVCDPIDFNQNSVFPDTTDLLDYLSVFSGGVCDGQEPADPPCNTDIDFNNDGVFPSSDDIEAFLHVLGGGNC